MTDERPLDEVDFQLIVALSLGMSQPKAGEWVITPEHPTGISERTVRYRMTDKKSAYERLIGRIAGEMRREMDEFKEITKEEYRAEIAKLRLLGAEVKKTALMQAISKPGDTAALSLGVKVAESIENRDFGMARQVVETTGDVNHNVFVWTPQTAQQLLAQEKDILASGDLLKALPGDVLDAEVVS